MVDCPVITGIGMVSPIGAGKDAFWNALIKKTSGIREISKFNTDDYSYHRAAEINDFFLEDYIDDQRFRRVADISSYAIGAVSLALADAGLKELDGRRTSLTLGVTHGAMNMSRQFHEGLVCWRWGKPYVVFRLRSECTCRKCLCLLWD